MVLISYFFFNCTSFSQIHCCKWKSSHANTQPRIRQWQAYCQSLSQTKVTISQPHQFQLGFFIWHAHAHTPLSSKQRRTYDNRRCFTASQALGGSAVSYHFSPGVQHRVLVFHSINILPPLPQFVLHWHTFWRELHTAAKHNSFTQNSHSLKHSNNVRWPRWPRSSRGMFVWVFRERKGEVGRGGGGRGRVSWLGFPAERQWSPHKEDEMIRPNTR